MSEKSDADRHTESSVSERDFVERHRSSGSTSSVATEDSTHQAALSRRSALAAGVGTVATLVAGCSSRSNNAWKLPDSTNASMVSEMQSPMIGRANGSDPTRIAVYTDFMCPHCARWNRRVLHALREEILKPGQAVLIHRDFPIPVNEQLSWPAAYAGRTVLDEAGIDPFWNYAETMYQQQDSIDSLDRIVEIAGNHGPDPNTVRKRVNQQMYYPVVRQNRQTGQDRGVEGTPTVLIEGNKVDDPSAENIINAVRS